MWLVVSDNYQADLAGKGSILAPASLPCVSLGGARLTSQDWYIIESDLNQGLKFYSVQEYNLLKLH